ncbi:TonB-dependent receptor [Chryseotalea sanaruensis]|uniref:TonB-dependent receptor n=2 Tax=Chryseotalea sanaruensis TaxID=2482724 RepID=A0A401UFD3_9BACT|nr:TonB-dependent receptor [Chryseotalea sanaruensis]
MAQSNYLDQTIQLNKNEISFQELINTVENQTDLRFSFNPNALPLNSKLTFKENEMSVKQALNAFNKAFGTNYQQKDKIILLKIVSNNDKQVSVYGYIRDAASGENLISATLLEKGTTKGTTSNSYGYFSYEVPVGTSLVLLCSYVGYQPSLITLTATTDTLLTISLTPQVMDEVVVVASELEAVQERVQMSSADVPIELIKSMPALLGETDILKALQLLPGVQSGTEGTSGMYVRGGSPDQNLILLDGVPVYNASHLFGFFSVFNDDAINHVELLKGGFPARYGGRLSSVLNISMKEGHQKEFHGEGSIGLISSKLSLEGPLMKGKSSYIVSARRTYADVVARPFVNKKSKGDFTGYYFYDLNAKVNYRPSDKDRIYLSAYTGNDKYYNSSRYDIKLNDEEYENQSDFGFHWGNITAALRWNHIFSPKLFSNASITYGSYNFNLKSESKEFGIDENGNAEANFSLTQYVSGIDDLTAKIDFEYQPNSVHLIRAGTNLIQHRFSPGATSLRSKLEIDTVLGSKFIDAIETQFYVEDEFSVGNRLKSNLGIHYSNFIVEGKTYASVQPRFSSRYLISSKFSLKASYATMAQFIHLLTNSGVGLPTDLWVPATPNIKPQTSWQVALGGAYELNNDFEFSVEAYYKEMENVIEYKEGANFLEPVKDWETKVEVGKGDSYGTELFLQKKQGRLNGWIGYTLAWSNREFENINNGNPYPFRYDVRHDLSIVGTYALNDHFELGSVFIYRTGTAVTLPIASYLNDGVEVDYYGGRNDYRMPAYHRIDLSATWKKTKKWGERAWVVSVYNLYFRRNPFFINLTTTPDNGRQFTQIALFTFVPSVSYQFKF